MAERLKSQFLEQEKLVDRFEQQVHTETDAMLAKARRAQLVVARKNRALRRGPSGTRLQARVARPARAAAAWFEPGDALRIVVAHHPLIEMIGGPMTARV